MADNFDTENTGWREPEQPGTWRKPEQPKQVAWREPALPKELDAEPKSEGEWHLPKPDDTTFDEEDEVDVVRPEDALWQQAADASDESDDSESMAAPEDLMYASATSAVSEHVEEDDEGPIAPEDLLLLLEHEDNNEQFQSGEMLAALSLSEDVPTGEVIRGEDDPITAALASMAQEGDSEEIADDMLSPAELAAAQAEALRQQAAEEEEDQFSTATPAESDPAEYARQQMQQLGEAPDIDFDSVLDEDDDDATGQLGATGELDPADYARQQMQQLGGTGGIAPPEPEPAPAVEPLTPRERELARRFRVAAEEVESLRRMHEQGMIPQDVYTQQLHEQMILDDDQIWWMRGVENDQWYRAEGEEWIPDTPEVLRREAEVSGATGGRKLDFLDDAAGGTRDVSTGVSDYEGIGTPSEGLGTGDDVRPAEGVPVTDPDYTVANPNVAMSSTYNDPTAAPTVESEPAFDPDATVRGRTIPSASIGEANIESPMRESGADFTAEPDIAAAEREGEAYRRAREQEQRSATRRIAFGLVAVVVLALLVGAGVIVMALLWYDGEISEWEPQIAALASYEPEFQTVTILDREGNEIGTLGQGGADRRVVSLEEISPEMIYAVLAVENQTFYEDPGWDFFSILRAFWQNVTAGEIQSGASTITQQVARRFVLQNTDPTFDRKSTEVIVAGEITQQYSKNDILELYLNEVNFGNQTYGVEAAAQFYFDKSAEDLNLAEAAMLASLIQAPSQNNPVINRELAFDNMRVVLQRMADAPCIQFQHAPYLGEPFCVTQEDVSRDEIAPQIALVEARDYLPREFGVEYPHFIQMVQAQLENYFGTNEIYQRGFVVRTTLAPTLQEVSQAALRDRVAALATNGVNTGTVMVTSPETCQILAMVGSPDFDNEEINGQINYALTYQQPGSAIKPIVYTAALEGVDRNGNGVRDQGEYYTPATITWDVETTYNTTPPYTPVNFDGEYHGAVPVRSALQNSYNVPAVKTFDFVGTDNFVALANQMGIRFQQEAQFGLPTALGSTEVRLFDMMIAYGTLANRGQHCEFVSTTGGQTTRLTTILEVSTADGVNVPIPSEIQVIRAINEGVAFLMNSILSDDLARAPEFGTNSALTLPDVLPTDGYVAAKSGTSDGSRDLWTMGYTSNMVVGVWLGRSDENNIQNLQGSTAAAPLWNNVMRVALQNTSPRPFNPPANGNVVQSQICNLTGALFGEDCTTPRAEYYLTSQPPPPPGSAVTATFLIDSWTGLIANEICPDNQVQLTFANISDPSAVRWMNNTTQGQNYARQVGLTVPVVPAPAQECSLNTVIPVARVSSPGGGQTVQGVIDITGAVNAEGLANYDLQYASVGAPNNFTTFATSQQQRPTAGSVIGSWDTTTVPDGEYIIRLAAFREGGGFLYRSVQPVIVNNPDPTATPTPQPQPTSPSVPIVPTQGITPLPFPTTVESQPVPDNPSPTPTIDLLGN